MVRQLGIYIGLLATVFILAIFLNCSGLSYRKNDKYLLNIVFLLLFLLCALRTYTVGRDVESYRVHYLDVMNHEWMDFDYIYFEVGYQLLMKLCVWIGISWQFFLGVVYAIILLPIYLFIKKYSRYTMLSILVFVCYMYFEFDLTGIRQALASSICLLAYIALLESKRRALINYIVVVTIAVFFHKSAFACYFLIPFLWIKDIKKAVAIIVAMTGIGLLGRTQILFFIKTIFMKDSLDVNSDLYFGGNLLFLLALAAIFVTVEIVKAKNNEIGQKCLRCYNTEGRLLNYDYNSVFTKSFILSIFFLVLFGMANSARSYMLLNQVIIILLPNVFSYFERKSRQIATVACTVFLLWFFYSNTLAANNFDIVPYKFFWQ